MELKRVAVVVVVELILAETQMVEKMWWWWWWWWWWWRRIVESGERAAEVARDLWRTYDVACGSARRLLSDYL